MVRVTVDGHETTAAVEIREAITGRPPRLDPFNWTMSAHQTEGTVGALVLPVPGSPVVLDFTHVDPPPKGDASSGGAPGWWLGFAVLSLGVIIRIVRAL